MNIESVGGLNKHELSPYSVTVLRDPESLSSLYLEITGRLKLIVTIKIEENRELDSTFDLSISSKNKMLEDAYRVYTNQLSRMISDIAFLDKYQKSRFIIAINIIEIFYKTDVLCHIVNALMLTLMLSKIEMRYFPVASICFIDDTEKLYSEEDAAQTDKNLTSVYLCKNLSNDDEVVSFKISGGHIHDERIDTVLSYLCGSANVRGRKMLEFTHKLATN